MHTPRIRRLWAVLPSGTFAAACSQGSATPTGSSRNVGAAELAAEPRAVPAASASPSSAHWAVGAYRFTIPEDFNGGIFGGRVDNQVLFFARRNGDGQVSGRFHYVQTYLGEDFIFSGHVTCLKVYDTPVLRRFEWIPPMTANRAKWGGLVEESNDPTQPPGVYIWFQSIDNHSGGGDGDTEGGNYPDLSTLSGFGDEAANEAFCNSDRVPNPRFGPHAVGSGQIVVR